MGKPTYVLLYSELGALLLWYKKKAKRSQGLKAANLINGNKIVSEGTQPPLLEIWTTDNEAGLKRLKKKDIKMGDTAYSWLVTFKKKELTADLGKRNKKERGEWRAKIDLMDANLVADDRDIYLKAGKYGDDGE